MPVLVLKGVANGRKNMQTENADLVLVDTSKYILKYTPIIIVLTLINIQSWKIPGINDKL